MPMRRVHLTHTFALPVARVFAFLSEHENLSLLFRAPVRRLRSGERFRNGVGSSRRIGPRVPLGLEETVVEFVPDELIVYRITRGGPLREHRGTMRFAALPDGGSRLDYEIRFRSPVPGLAAGVARMLEWSIASGLHRVEERA
ncbi:MAG: hypothetical protein JWN32_778 [Solirubrobacterales bacterium]|jgi:uncharacterized protein YndB with AHSA1/START domain|nr:hypothetical protein [Solirubrobacterales bacterium]